MIFKNSKLTILYFILSILLAAAIILVPISKVKAYENITADQVKNEITSPTCSILLIDVRTPDEYKNGHIAKSINIPIQILQEKMAGRNISKDTKIVVYCASGIRTRKASEMLEELGFTKVYSLGGLNDWPYEIVKQ